MNTMQSQGTGVPDMIGSLSEPDILAIQQYSTTREPAVPSLKKLDSRRFVRCDRKLQKYTVLP